jgi:hypothetical protein
MTRRVAATAAELKRRKLLGPIVKMEPLDIGRTPGKLKLTFADGTKAIFKPARRGEAGKKPKD